MENDYIRVFRAFTDENRVRILELLCQGEQCACILLHDLKISQPTLSHHMKILCDSGIVKSRREGKWSYYAINTEGCEHASRLLKAVINRHMGSTLRIVRFAYRFLRRIRKLSKQAAESGKYGSGARCCPQTC